MKQFFKSISLLFLIFLTFKFFATDKILIITHSFNRPDFLELQVKTFKKFLQDDYEFVVFNDAKTPGMKSAIIDACKQLDVQCFDIPTSAHFGEWASKRTSDAIQYSLQKLGFDHNGIVFIIDSDMFLIKPFSIAKYLEGYDMAGLPQNMKSIHYLWNGLIFMDMRTLPNKRSINFDCNPINGIALDTGGHLYYYLNANPNLRLKKTNACGINSLPIDISTLKERGYSDNHIQLILEGHSDQYPMEFHVDNTFLHYRAGGNWMRRDKNYHDQKTKLLKKFLDSL